MSHIPDGLIAIEEHYWDDRLTSHFVGPEADMPEAIRQRLYDFAGERIADMDAAGIECTVLSHGAPSGQRLSADVGVPLVKAVNDRLFEAVQGRPDRFAAFAALPTAAPDAAADELERCIGRGFKGAMIHGATNGEFIDLPKYWPIFARAEQLDIPIYLHPAFPDAQVVRAYYEDYLEDFPMFARPAWGFTVECATQAIRLMLSGIFERHPNLKIILGHMGESLPFQIWRIDSALRRPGQKSSSLRDIFASNFWITTSGFFSTPALQCSMMELGADRIMFAVDWPFVASSMEGAEWIRNAPISRDDRRKIMSGNARSLLKL